MDRWRPPGRLRRLSQDLRWFLRCPKGVFDGLSITEKRRWVERAVAGKTYVTPLITKGRASRCSPPSSHEACHGEAYRAPARSAATPRARPRDEGSRGPPPGKRAHRGLSQIHDHGAPRHEDERRAGAICPRARNVEKAQLSSHGHLLVLTVSEVSSVGYDGAR
jgi:hypothetical protein